MTESKTLTAGEERILRMRSGASLSPESPLESKLDGLEEDMKTDVAARLALMQVEIMNAMSTDDSVDNERRSRIVASLQALASEE